MINSQTLDIVIGLAVVFLTVSLVCSALNETLSTILSLRAGTLKTALDSLLGDGLADAVINSPVIPAAHPLAGKQPSYIEPGLFAVALLDEIARPVAPPAASTAFAHVNAAVNGPVPNPLVTANVTVQRSLAAFMKSANGDYDKLLGQTSDWFNAYMDRIGGSYKRRASLFLAIFAVFVVAILNVDALKIYKQLSAQPAYAASVAARADFLIKKVQLTQVGQLSAAQLGQQIDQLNSVVASMPIPIGWHAEDAKNPLQKAIGLLISVIAATLGAPFWFDTLSKLANPRSTGPKPH